jgi:hypothetical protein
VQIKLSIQRLRTLQEKKLALAKKARRDIADLVAKSRIETAKLRVEGLIQDDIYVELLELLEVGRASGRAGGRRQASPRVDQASSLPRRPPARHTFQLACV